MKAADAGGPTPDGNEGITAVLLFSFSKCVNPCLR